MRISAVYYLIAGLCWFAYPMSAFSQSSHTITFTDAIRMAQTQSVEFRIVNYSSMVGYWNYKSFRSSLLPNLSLSATIPNYNRTIDRVTLPTGKELFVARNFSYSTMQLDLSQNIGITGGSLSISSRLNRLDIFGDQHSKQYSNFPMLLSYQQNSFFYNTYKWRKRIEPLRYQESRKQYLESVEQIAINTIDQYFKYLLAQAQHSIDEQNLKNADTLLKLTQLKLEIGMRDVNDFMEARLNLLNARRGLAVNMVSLEGARQQFCQYLGLRDSIFMLELPVPEKDTKIDPVRAVAYARQNRKKVVEMRRRRLESEQKLAEIKSLSGPKISLQANIGLSQSNVQLEKTLTDLQRQQSVVLSVSIPLIDWGMNRSNIQRAKADVHLVASTITQEEMAFEQEVKLQVMEFNSLKEQLQVAKEAREIAVDRFERAKQKYRAGNMSFLELTNAQQQKDYAIKDFIFSIRSYWMSYYLIRRMCLYDFEMDAPVAAKKDMNYDL